MARPVKETVDYFPHYVKSGRTIYILENRFGNDGYAFWFKLLEILGESEGHCYDCSNTTNWEFLLAKTRIDDTKANDIINVLIGMGKIDKELWEKKRILWIDNFLRNLSNVYRMRHVDLPQKPIIESDNTGGVNDKRQNNPEGQELFAQLTDKEKKSKEKERKEEKSIVYPCEDIMRLWNNICGGILPKVKALNDNRRKKIKCRLSECGAKTADDMIAWAQDLFKQVAESSFLCGQNNNQWTATFDWLFENANNWVKVSEGNYRNDRGSNRGGTGVQNQLGVGEYITQDGKRTYGSGRANIPLSAPPRPSEKYQWSAESQNWIML